MPHRRPVPIVVSQLGREEFGGAARRATPGRGRLHAQPQVSIAHEEDEEIVRR